MGKLEGGHAAKDSNPGNLVPDPTVAAIGKLRSWVCADLLSPPLWTEKVGAQRADGINPRLRKRSRRGLKAAGGPVCPPTSLQGWGLPWLLLVFPGPVTLPGTRTCTGRMGSMWKNGCGSSPHRLLSSPGKIQLGWGSRKSQSQHKRKLAKKRGPALLLDSWGQESGKPGSRPSPASYSSQPPSTFSGPQSPYL